MNPLPPRALVIEDDRSWQDILAELLSDAGLQVDVAGSLPVARALIAAHPHRLAVVDLSLSGQDANNRDGLQALADLQQHDPACANVLLTGFATVELAVSALTEFKAHTCLRKELFQRDQFLELARSLLAAPPGAAGELPAAGPPPGERSAAAQAEILPVLVVEDDAGWRSILGELLGDAGCPARLCSSYGEALGLLRRERYALAVVDLSLQGWNAPPGSAEALDGYRLLSTLKTAGLPAVVVSGVGTPDAIEHAYRDLEVFAFIEKQSFDREAFIRTILDAQRSAPGELQALTGREREVLHLLARGLTNKEIARELVIAPDTVKRHLKAIFQKLGIHTRAAAAAKALGRPAPDD